MILVVTSTEDVASMNIRGRLLTMAPWTEAGGFEGTAVLAHGALRMALLSKLHLFYDAVDSNFAEATGERPELVVFASKHRSESGKATLTVHPIGNYGKADFGGKAETLVPSAPVEMTCALRALREHGSGLPYEISFETTHHGPYMTTPAFFIEIGSDESRWPDETAAEAIAKTILELSSREREPRSESIPIVVGVGGGHYAPRHTDVAVAGKASFGHMVPNYALEQEPERRLQMALDATSDASAVYFHRKAMSKPLVRQLEGWCGERGLEILRAGDKG
jgi:D-aminoacyl-tRNA deacylase